MVHTLQAISGRANRREQALHAHPGLVETCTRMVTQIGVDPARADERVRAVLDGTCDAV